MQDDVVKMPPNTEEHKPAQKVVQDVVAPPQEAEPARQPQAQEKKPAPEPEVASDQSTSKKSTVPKGVVLVAFIFCFGLIGLSVFIAMNESEKIEKIATPTATEQAAKPTVPDVQGALAETDQLPEPADDPEAEFTDESLGL